MKRPKLVKKKRLKKGRWYSYLLRSRSRNRTYIGATNDPVRRLAQHNGERAGGARYTKTGRPWKLVMLLGPYVSASEAMRVEWRWKRFRGAERLVYRRWVAELDDKAEDRDGHLHARRRRRRRRR